MKISVKTLKGNNFPIEVQPTDTAADVKKNIESVQGADVYPASQQVLIHQGKILKDDTTLEENNVAENSFVVIMLKKSNSTPAKVSASGAAATSEVASTADAPHLAEASTVPPAAVSSVPLSPASQLGSTPAPAAILTQDSSAALVSGDVYGQAASNLLAGSGLEQTVQQILDMGGGTWDRDTVISALHAAFNNPERAVEYLYSGIPERPAIPPPQSGGSVEPAGAPSVSQQTTQPAPVPSSGPNANPLNLFPQGMPNLGSVGAAGGALDLLRNNAQFQTLQAMVQAHPELLEPMLESLGQDNPEVVRLIQENQSEFLQLINEHIEGGEGSILDELAGSMPQTIEVTPEEREAIERLEAMGFDQTTVLEVYFACSKDETLAANYLLDHLHEMQE